MSTGFSDLWMITVYDEEVYNSTWFYRGATKKIAIEKHIQRLSEKFMYARYPSGIPLNEETLPHLIERRTDVMAAKAYLIQCGVPLEKLQQIIALEKDKPPPQLERLDP